MSDDQLAGFASKYEQQTGQKFQRFGSLQDAEAFAEQRSSQGGGMNGTLIESRPHTGPWDKYAAQKAPAGPWSKYAAAPEQQGRSPLEFAGNMARDFVEGIPVAGPLLTGLTDQVGSRVIGAVTGKDPQKIMDDRAAGQEAYRAQNPILSTATQIAGGTAALAPIAATATGAKALGLTGPLLQRAFQGGVSGGTIAAADTAARGGDIGESAISAVLGTGIGAGGASVAPYAARAAKSAGSGLANLASKLGFMPATNTGTSAAEKALNIVGRGLARDQVTPGGVPSQLSALGPDAVLADLGPNMTRQAAAVASLPGEGQTVVRDILGGRNKGVNQRIQAEVNDILGRAPVPSQVQAEIGAAKKALSPEYEAALANANRVDTSPVALSLDSEAVNLRGAAQQSVKNVRSMLNVLGTDQLDPNPRTLLETRKAIDGMLNGEMDGNVKRVLSSARKQIDELLAEAVPGIKQVDAKFAELSRQSEGVDFGQTVLESGRTAPRPSEVANVLMEGANPQGLFVGPSGAPFRVSQGARAEIDRIIGTTANNLTALKSALKGDGSWNRDRLVSVFGQGKTDKLLDVLDREMTMQRTYNTVMQNSETAARAAAQQDIAPRQFGENPGGLTSLLLKIPQKGANALAKTRSEAVNKELIKVLMSNPAPETLDRIAAISARRGKEGMAAPYLPASVTPLVRALTGN